MQLDPSLQYYVYDFWNNKLVGLINAGEEFKQQVRAGEARMMSFHAKEDYPQFISTNRHIMQGYVDLKEVIWNKKSKSLSSVANVVEDDPYEIIIAVNGKKLNGCKVDSGTCNVKMLDDKSGIAVLTINTTKTGAIKWKVKFK